MYIEFGQMVLKSDGAWVPQNAVNTCSEVQCNVYECGIGMEKQN